MTRSSNPFIREAVKRGEKIESKIIGTFDVITRADADYVEGKLIEQIPSEIRLNRVVPRPKMDEVVIRNDVPVILPSAQLPIVDNEEVK